MASCTAFAGANELNSDLTNLFHSLVESSSQVEKEESEVDLGNHFSLQIASYPSQNEAIARIKTLPPTEIVAFFMPAVVNDKTWYRVYIGRFKNQEKALQHKKALVKKKAIKEEYEDLAYFEPFYLKDFVAGKPKRYF